MTHACESHEPVPRSDLRETARRVGRAAAGRADADDVWGGFPRHGVQNLHESGLLLAPFSKAMGGQELGSGLNGGLALMDVLVAIGSGNLSLGRLYEGHVNSVLLVDRYGSDENRRILQTEAIAGRLSGVWMAEADRPLRVITSEGKSKLIGAKVLCSGTGHIRRPLVAAGRDHGGAIMLLPHVDEPSRCDTDAWTATGMRATATGSIDFDEISIATHEIVGQGDDYLRSPIFRGGAWRVLAVQLGGLTALLDAYRGQLVADGRGDDPIQRARFGEALLAVETARLWVHNACTIAQGDGEPAAIDAYVDLARNAFEQSALRTVALAQKAIGLKSFLRPNPIERIARDLTTYLRQPALDMSLDSAALFHLSRPRTHE